MSDFLGRMAARAVGAAPVAQPRPAAPFAGEAHGGLEEIGEEVASSPPGAPAAARARPFPDAMRTDATATSRGTAEPVEEARPPEHPAAPVAPRHDARVSEPQTRPAAAARAEPPAEVVPAAPAERVREAARADAAPPATAAAPSPVPTVTAAPAAAARAAPASLPPATTTRAEPATPLDAAPPVRVHIGRLEVRANLQPEPPRARRAAPDRDDGALSLADYLRGAGGKR